LWNAHEPVRANVDFMIGSAQLDIVGELADGTSEPIFAQGNRGIDFVG
jgi:aminopeptidase